MDDTRLEAVNLGGGLGEFSLALGSNASRVPLFFHGHYSGSFTRHHRVVTEAGRYASPMWNASSHRDKAHPSG